MIASLPPLLAVAAVLAIAGCGGDDSDADSGGSGGGETIETSSLTKAEFTEQANEICAKGSEDLLERLGAYMRKSRSSSKTGGELAAEAIKKTVLPEVRNQIDEIEELGAPSGDEKQIEAFLDAQRRGVASLEKRSSIALNADLDPAFAQAAKLASLYGLESCAYG